MSIKEYFRDKKFKKQKAEKGYSNLDLCDVSYWFQTVVADMITDFEQRKCGSPELPFEEIDTMDSDWVTENLNAIYQEILEDDDCYGDISSMEDISKNFSIDDCYIRWRLILKRMSYCLKQSSEEFCKEINELEKSYMDAVFPDGEDLFVETGEVSKSGHKLYKLNTKEADKDLTKAYHEREDEIRDYRNAMKDEAFSLISKYFFNLWD